MDGPTTARWPSFRGSWASGLGMLKRLKTFLAIWLCDLNLVHHWLQTSYHERQSEVQNRNPWVRPAPAMPGQEMGRVGREGSRTIILSRKRFPRVGRGIGSPGRLPNPSWGPFELFWGHVELYKRSPQWPARSHHCPCEAFFLRNLAAAWDGHCKNAPWTSMLARLGAMLAHLRFCWGPCSPILGLCWGYVATSWPAFGPCRGRLPQWSAARAGAPPLPHTTSGT